MTYTAAIENTYYPCAFGAKGRAVIYNRYLKTVGGGERSCIEFARALEDIGYQITLVTDPNSNISVEKLSSVFGIYPKTHWQLVEVAPEKVEEYCRKNAFDVFVNHTYSSYIPSPAPIGLYLLMFPHQISEDRLEAMKTYKAIFCISPFVELYLKARWGKDYPVVVFPPPISEEHFKSNSDNKKEKLILNLGRFNTDGHSKCQKEAIKSFLELKKAGVLDDEWRMLVAGHLNEGAENKAYFEMCQNIAPDFVTVKKNISFSELTSYYKKASVLFQFTGYGLDFGEIPERCEHLGLVAMDALCYGTIPVVFERSGVSMLHNWGDSLYSFRNLEDLKKIMQYINDDFGTAAHQFHIRRCKAEAAKYSYRHYKDKIKNTLESQSLKAKLSGAIL